LPLEPISSSEGYYDGLLLSGEVDLRGSDMTVKIYKPEGMPIVEQQSGSRFIVAASDIDYDLARMLSNQINREVRSTGVTFRNVRTAANRVQPRHIPGSFPNWHGFVVLVSPDVVHTPAFRLQIEQARNRRQVVIPVLMGGTPQLLKEIGLPDVEFIDARSQTPDQIVVNVIGHILTERRRITDATKVRREMWSRLLDQERPTVTIEVGTDWTPQHGAESEPQPGAVPPNPDSAALEQVAFTHYYPSEVQLGEEFPLQFYLYHENASDQVQADFEKRRTFKTLDKSGTGLASRLLERGTPFTIVPVIKHAHITPHSATVIWQDDFEHVLFHLRLDSSVTAGAAINGLVRVYVGPLLVSALTLETFVKTSETTARGGPFTRGGQPLTDFRSTSLAKYKRLFISYSRDDQALVQAMERIFSEYPELSTFVDYKSEVAGDDWKKVIEDSITAADALELFWSPHAAKSDSVRDEWEYALKINKPVIPVIFGRPRPEIPEPLADCDFQEFGDYIRLF
jgi:hypothetical protein